MHYVLTDKINSSIRIRIRWILSVKICIWQMRILTSFITSLQQSERNIVIEKSKYLGQIWVFVQQKLQTDIFISANKEVPW